MEKIVEREQKWACGCEEHEVEFNGEWIEVSGDYCPFMLSLIYRSNRERDRPNGPCSKGGYERHKYVYRKLAELHKSSQPVVMTLS